MITKETRRESLEKTDKNTRYKEILRVLRIYKSLTAREVCYILGYKDLNAVKPRITELKQKGIIKEKGIKYDTLTNRKVTIYCLEKKSRR